MTVSELETFEKELFAKLRKNSKKSLNIIEKNEKLVDNYLNGSNTEAIKKFVNGFNDVFLDKSVKKYKLFEAVLNHKLFTKVLAQFRESDVLIRACKDVKRYYSSYEFEDYDEIVNKKVVEWLLTMNINYAVQDEKGMTALMYAVKTVKLYFAVKVMMTEKSMYLLDNDGNNVLFHAADNYSSLKEFIKYKDSYNIDHVNNNNENLYCYCSRKDKITSQKYLDTLKEYKCAQPNLANNDGKTAAMYLIFYAKYKELISFVKYYQIDPNYVSKKGHSLVSSLIQRYYTFYTKKIVQKEGFGLNLTGFKKFSLIFEALKNMGCDFSISVDENGTTVPMILSKLHDEVTHNYLFGNEPIVNVKTDIKYEEIDVSDPNVAKNLKSIQMWINEALNPKGMINTQTAGLMLMGLGH